MKTKIDNILTLWVLAQAGSNEENKMAVENLVGLSLTHFNIEMPTSTFPTYKYRYQTDYIAAIPNCKTTAGEPGRCDPGRSRVRCPRW